MESLSALLAFVWGIHRAPTQRPVTRSFDIFFDLRLNKRSSKQSWGWWFGTPSRPLWHHPNEFETCWTDRSLTCYWMLLFVLFIRQAISGKDQWQVTGPYGLQSFWSKPEQWLHWSGSTEISWNLGFFTDPICYYWFRWCNRTWFQMIETPLIYLS